MKTGYFPELRKIHIRDIVFWAVVYNTLPRFVYKSNSSFSQTPCRRTKTCFTTPSIYTNKRTCEMWLQSQDLENPRAWNLNWLTIYLHDVRLHARAYSTELVTIAVSSLHQKLLVKGCGTQALTNNPEMRMRYWCEIL